MTNQYEELITSITSISHSLRRVKTQETKKAGLRGSDANILLELNLTKEGLSNVQISEICEMDKAAVSRQIKNLCEHGWVRTVKKDGKRYGATNVLTAKGKKLAEKIQNSGTELLSNKKTGMTQTELAKLNKQLKDLSEKLKK